MQSYCQYVPEILCWVVWPLDCHRSERRFVNVSERKLPVSKGNHLPTKPQFAYLIHVFFRVFAGFSRFNVDVFLYKPLKNYFMMLHHFGSWDTSMNSWSILVKGSLDSSPQRDFCNFNLPVILRFAIQNHQKNQNPEWCCDFTKNSMDGFLSTTLA